MPTELLLSAPYTLQLEPLPDPPLNPGKVRAEAVLSVISHGTEVSLYRGTAPFFDRAFNPDLRLFLPAETAQSYPDRLGYEWAGRVTETSPDVTGFVVGGPVHLPLPHGETHVVNAAERAARGDGCSWSRTARPSPSTRLPGTPRCGFREFGGADVATEFSGVYAALRLGEAGHHNRVSMVSSQRGWGAGRSRRARSSLTVSRSRTPSTPWSIRRRKRC